MPVIVTAASLGGTLSTLNVDAGTTVSDLKDMLTEKTAQEPEDVDLVLGGTVLSNDLNIDELARGTPPQTRKRKKSPRTLCLAIVKRAKPGPLLSKDALARFVAENTSDRVVKVSIYGEYGRLFDRHTLAVGESWTYARVRVDWREKSVLVRFESGDEVGDVIPENTYTVIATASDSAAEPQRWVLGPIDWQWDFAERLSDSEDSVAPEDESDAGTDPEDSVAPEDEGDEGDDSNESAQNH
jgi:hypothetical protein